MKLCPRTTTTRAKVSRKIYRICKLPCKKIRISDLQKRVLPRRQSTMTRLILLIKVHLFRLIHSILVFCDLYLSHPLPQHVSFTRKIKSTVSSTPGSINLLFYTPPSYKLLTPSNPPPDTASTTLLPHKNHPLLINFHGGGFTTGHARDDARWATAVTSITDAAVISVEYRLAPAHPFPTGIEDCVSAVLWLWEHADQLGLDRSKTAFSGFSAGANFCFAVAFRLAEEVERLKREGEEVREGRLVVIAAFYGACDWTRSREEKNASNPDLIALPMWLLKMFDEAYLVGKLDMGGPLLSPGLADEELLRRVLPGRIVMVLCGGDQLLAEERAFEKRLRGCGKKVSVYVAVGEMHAWDKKPTWKKGNAKRDEAYVVAIKSLQEAWS